MPRSRAVAFTCRMKSTVRPEYCSTRVPGMSASNGRIIALCGVRDLVVVEMPDAVLVCHRDSVQEVKKLLPLLPPHIL